MKFAIPICALASLTAIESGAVQLNLTSAAIPSGEINGAMFYSFIGGGPAGTGVFDAFYRLSTSRNNTSEEGYNAGTRPVMPDVNTSVAFTRDIQLSVVPLVDLAGTDYYEFVLDINQQASAPFLSLDELQIYTRPTALTGNANTLAALTGSSTLRYDLDGGPDDSTILLNYNLAGSGSGRADLLAYIPASLFGPTSEYVYLYSQLGAAGGQYEANGGFEGWGVRQGVTPPARVPDGGATAMLLGLGVLGLGYARRKLA